MQPRHENSPASASWVLGYRTVQPRLAFILFLVMTFPGGSNVVYRDKFHLKQTILFFSYLQRSGQSFSLFLWSTSEIIHHHIPHMLLIVTPDFKSLARGYNGHRVLLTLLSRCAFQSLLASEKQAKNNELAQLECKLWCSPRSSTSGTWISTTNCNSIIIVQTLLGYFQTGSLCIAPAVLELSM